MRKMSGSSPHTRGALRRRVDEDEHRRIIPAYAGSTAHPRITSRGTEDHPRIRGEHPRVEPWGRLLGGSSPHTRGAHTHPSDSGPTLGIIPAYAGSTLEDELDDFPGEDHPRIRGEHDYAKRAPAGLRGSSPHTRGAPRADLYEVSVVADHPRIRGEHSVSARSCATVLGSSPHTRGARTASCGTPSIRRDHPRIRGEHSTRTPGTPRRSGSSPHTRGARPELQVPRHRAQDHPRIRGEHRP